MEDAIQIDGQNLEDYEEDFLSKYTILPTTTLCTTYMLRRHGKIRVGEITMEPENLRWLDKPWSLAFAAANGIAIPETWDDVCDLPPDVGPLFYKPAIEGVTGKRAMARSRADLPVEVTKPRSGFIIQEYIDSDGVYSFGFLADRGKVIVGVGLRELSSYPPAGGSASIMELIDNEMLTEEAKRLISAASYSGWGLVEFKRCPRRNAFVLMEINPKMWASVELTLRTQPVFMKLLFGVDIKAEPIQRMWWPRRFAASGIDNWPRNISKLSGAQRSREGLDVRAFAAAVLPYGARDTLRHLKSRSWLPFFSNTCGIDHDLD